jgi:hypothetical protein
MNKRIIGISAISIIIIVSISLSMNLEGKKNTKNIVFHVTLASPELYSNEEFKDKFSIDPGTYFFRFVPNGSSPETLSIELTGQNYKFTENFNLIGIPHESETAKYFTWIYEGKKNIVIDSLQEISIKINPNGNVNGSVSVDLIKKEA